MNRLPWCLWLRVVIQRLDLAPRPLALMHLCPQMKISYSPVLFVCLELKLTLLLKRQTNTVTERAKEDELVTFDSACGQLLAISFGGFYL